MASPRADRRRGVSFGRVLLWLFGPAFVALVLTAWGIHMGTRHSADVRLFEWRFFDIGELPPQLGPPQQVAPVEVVAPGYGGRYAPIPQWGAPTVGFAPPTVAPPAPPTHDAPAWAVPPVAYGPPALAPQQPTGMQAPPGQAAASAVDGTGAQTGARSVLSSPAEAPPPAEGPPAGWAPPVPVAGPPATSLSPAVPGPTAASPTPPGSSPDLGAPFDPAAERMAMPIRVRVKVLLDERLTAAHPDWLVRVQHELAEASDVYRMQLGITLSLVGVVSWSGARDGLAPAALFQDLRRHEREGADVVLGWLSVPLPLDAYGYGAPAPDSAYHGVRALVGMAQEADGSYSHRRGILRALGALLGALPVRADDSQAYRLASWMSEAPPPAGRPPWIDVDNRRRMLLRKGLPFAPEVGP